MRVFVPVTAGQLAELGADGSLGGPVHAFAVTPRLVGELGGLDGEEAEYAVTTAAAESAYEGLQAAGAEIGRRIVLVADVPDAGVEEGEGAGSVDVRSGVTVEQLDAVLADPEPRLLHALAGEDLGWFGVQEIDALLV